MGICQVMWWKGKMLISTFGHYRAEFHSMLNSTNGVGEEHFILRLWALIHGWWLTADCRTAGDSVWFTAGGCVYFHSLSLWVRLCVLLIKLSIYCSGFFEMSVFFMFDYSSIISNHLSAWSSMWDRAVAFSLPVMDQIPEHMFLFLPLLFVLLFFL